MRRRMAPAARAGRTPLVECLLFALLFVSASAAAALSAPPVGAAHLLAEGDLAASPSLSRARRDAKTNPSHPQHENPLETVRFDLAAASLFYASRRPHARELGDRSPFVRLSVNASFSDGGGGGAAGKKQPQQQVVHALPATRAAEVLRVSWQGLKDPRADDMIAVLLLEGESDDLASAAPAKFALLGGKAAAAATTKNGSSDGSLDLRLANYLVPRVAIALFRGGPSNPKLAEGAASVVVLRNAAHGRAPLHRRLSLSATESGNENKNEEGKVSLAVRWTTRDPGGSPGVWWTDEPPAAGGRLVRSSYRSFAPAALPSSSSSALSTYSRADLCGGEAAGVGFVPPGHFHTAVMRGLIPGRRYWYVVGDGGGKGGGASSSPPEEAVRSPEAAFLAPPSSSSSSLSSEGKTRVRVLVTADMGQSEPDGWSQTPDYTKAASVRTAKALAREVVESSKDDKKAAASAPPPFSLVLHAGDISYARGYGALWAAFHDLVEPIASRVPYQVAPGNHEVNWPGAGMGGRDRFSAETGEAGARASPPRPEGGEEARAWWAARGGKPPREAFDSGGECGVPYARRFAMPSGGEVVSPGRKKIGGGGGGELGREAKAAVAGGKGQKEQEQGRDQPWYAFDHGPHARFVVFSTEHDFMPGSEQHSFLERAFAGVRTDDGGGSNKNASSSRPWLILVGHRPLHVCSTWDGFADGDGAVSRALRVALDPLFKRYGVDLTISGHHHSFGRTCPVAPTSSFAALLLSGDEPLGPTCARGGGGGGGGEGGGVVHLVSGNGGAPLSLNPSFPPSPIWDRLRYDWGYLRLDITRKVLRVESVTPPPASDGSGGGGGGEVVDAFRLERKGR